jgi:hypothetical protein
MVILLLLLLIIFIYFIIIKRPIPDKKLIGIGERAIKNKNLILCTCVRDAEDNINNIKKLYRYFTRYFNKVKLLVMENDSKDKTREKLLDLKSDINIDVIGCGLNSNVCNIKLNNDRTSRNYKRFRRMAIVRNELVSHIKKIQNNYNYCIMFDGDMKLNIYTNGFLESMYHLEYKHHIDAISCYGLGYASLLVLNKIYDGIAYKPVDNDNLINLLTTFRLSNLTKVISSFNGLSIYKLPFTDNIKYDIKTKECEHISFNKNFNIYLNPKFVVKFNKIL